MAADLVVDHITTYLRDDASGSHQGDTGDAPRGSTRR